MITRKLNYIIKIKKLTKESEFHAKKTKKNDKNRQKKGAPSTSPLVYNENGWYL